MIVTEKEKTEKIPDPYLRDPEMCEIEKRQL